MLWGINFKKICAGSKSQGKQFLRFRCEQAQCKSQTLTNWVRWEDQMSQAENTHTPFFFTFPKAINAAGRLCTVV